MPASSSEASILHVTAAALGCWPCSHSCSQDRMSACAGASAIGRRSNASPISAPGLFGVGNPGTLQTMALVAKKDANASASRGAAVGRIPPDRDSRGSETRCRQAGARCKSPVDESANEVQSHSRWFWRGGTDIPTSPNRGAGDIHVPPRRSVPARRGRNGPLQAQFAKTRRSRAGIGMSARVTNARATASNHLSTCHNWRWPIFPGGTWAYWIDALLRRTFRRFSRCSAILPRRGKVWQPRTISASCATGGKWRKRNGDAPAQATAGALAALRKRRAVSARWYESPRHRVNWQDDGREIKQAIVDRYPYLNGQWKWVAKNTSYYGRRGVTWSYLTSGRFCRPPPGKGRHLRCGRLVPLSR